MAHSGGKTLSSSSVKTASTYHSSIAIKHPLSTSKGFEENSASSDPYLSNPKTLSFWASAMVVLPVFLQAPWVRLHPFSACLFTFFLLGIGFCLVEFGGERWSHAGSLLVGVSGSWLGGCLFWGWLRAHPLWHLPVEAIALPLACVGIGTRWRIGAVFYLACLLGTAFTDILMVFTGVMDKWPSVVNAQLSQAPQLLHEAAQDLLHLKPILFLLSAAALILFLANLMHQRSKMNAPIGTSWLVASAALKTTLWVDGLFLLTALIQPRLSGLI